MSIFRRNVCLTQRVRLHLVLFLALASLTLSKPCPLEIKISGSKAAISQKKLDLLSPGTALAQDLNKEEVGERNIKLLFSDEADAGSFLYSPKKGESIYDICRKFNMSPELIKEINGLDEADKLPEKLKIVRGDFSIVIEREKNILTLYRGVEFFKEYRVATGRNFSTPLGEYWINSKLISPPWIFEGKVITPEESGYPLGTRWMGLSNTRIGIHGTKDPQFIGQYASSGCVRMRNSDIEELFKIVPFGTKVIIKE